jgi:Tfp pilus assembly protein PilZ
MGEKRKSHRHGRRLRVHFGESTVSGFPHSGLTNDVSTSGLFVVTSQTPKPGTRLHLEVMLQGETPLYLEGVVARLVLVPPGLRQIMKAGVGVRYLLGHELLSELSPALQPPKKDDLFTLTFDDEASWKAALQKELQRGGVFVWSPKPVAPNSIVSITVDLRYAGRTLSFDARVVHVMPGADGRHGIALMFVDAAATTATLASTV